jgi:hypothetical protein
MDPKFEFGITHVLFIEAHMPTYFNYCAHNMNNHVNEKGGDVMMNQNIVHSWQLLDHEHQIFFLWIERKLVMWGHQDNSSPPHILHINHKMHYQPWVMKIFFVLT